MNDSGVYYYRHPKFMRQKANLGSDQRLALARARQLGRKFDELERIQNSTELPSLVTDAPRFDEALLEFTEFWVKERQLRPTTVEHLRQRTNFLARRLGSMPVNLITTVELDEALRPQSAFEHGKSRNHLMNFFKWLRARGEYPALAPNPAEQLLTRRIPPKRRARLTLEQFRAIYHRAEVWLQDLMLLCLATTLRRGDLVNLRFDQVEGEYLKVKIQKSDSVHRGDGPAYLKIWLPAFARERIDAAYWRAARFIPESPFIIHRVPVRRKKGLQLEHSTQVLPGYASHAFAKAREKAAVRTAGGKAPPTIHEIRALAGHLLEGAGHSPAEIQVLMAHTDERQTTHYLSDHTVKFTTVKLDLGDPMNGFG